MKKTLFLTIIALLMTTLLFSFQDGHADTQTSSNPCTFSVVPAICIYAQPHLLFIQAGSSGTTTLSLTSGKGFAGMVKFSTDAFSGISVRNPSVYLSSTGIQVKPTISVAPSVPSGIYKVIIHGSSGIISGSTTIIVAVPLHFTQQKISFKTMAPTINGLVIVPHMISDGGMSFWDMKTHSYNEFPISNHRSSPSTFSGSKTVMSKNSVVIPNWIKNLAKEWSANQIDDSIFLQSLQYLVQHHIIQVPHISSSSSGSTTIPFWVKNTVRYWSTGQVSDDEFANSLQYMISKGMIKP